MRRTIYAVVLLFFLGSTSFTLPECLLACPLEISEFNVTNKAIKEASHSQEPCCAKKNGAPQEEPKRPISCPLLLSKSQPQAAERLLRTVPELQTTTYVYYSYHVPVRHSERLCSGEFPARARSTPIILEKQSLLI
jgi:hypothetical protein